MLRIITITGLVLLLLCVLGPVTMVIQSAWAGRDATEPGLSLTAQRAALAVETSQLVLLTLIVALPIGTSVGLFVFRTDIPGRYAWRLLVLLPALIPMDLHATAWLAALGPQGLARWLGIPLELGGVIGAAWVHAMASISWVVAFVGAAASMVEAELEEDCLLMAGPARTMWHVTLRRSAGAVAAAGLIVAVQTAGEMAVTDLLQVRTYAETVYTEFALAGRVGAATATAVPGVLLWCLLVAIAGTLIVRRVPPSAEAFFARRPMFHLGRWRWPASFGCLTVAVVTLGVPAGSLIWRAGLKYSKVDVSRPSADPAPKQRESASASASVAVPPRWSAIALVENVGRSARSAGDQLALSLFIALATAFVTIPIAWGLLYLADQNRLGWWLLGALTCLLFALPGPVVGIGMKLMAGGVWRILGADSLLDLPAVQTLWGQIVDSPAVLVWLHVLRALPFAVALLWAARRMVNRRVLEAAALDGAGAWAQFRYVEFPACRAAILAAAVACAVVSLGELGGSVIVTPPGLQPLSVRIFTFAHWGMESHLAGICLVLLAVTAAGSLTVLACLSWSLRSLKD